MVSSDKMLQGTTLLVVTFCFVFGMGDFKSDFKSSHLLSFGLSGRALENLFMTCPLTCLF